MYSRQHIETLKKAIDSTVRGAALLRRECPKISTITDTEAESFQKRLEAALLSMCDVDITVQVVEKAAQEIDINASNPGNLKVFDEIFQRKNQNRKSATEHPMYCKFIEVSKGVQEDNSEHDLSIREERPNIKCPISKKVMKTPMKNKLCGHTYDLTSIQGLLKHSQKGIRCPVPGCACRRFKLADMEVDEELKKYILKHKAKK